jgi:hypothetical protein
VNVHTLNELMPGQFYQLTPHQQERIASPRCMKSAVAQINLVFAWAGILLGFLSGTLLGLFFHRENWLGGYASLKRRLYRLAHISFFGLGAVNFLFYVTAQSFSAAPAVIAASWCFITGAATMPVCCLVMAHFPRGQAAFAVPVLSLAAGGALTLIEIIKL